VDKTCHLCGLPIPKGRRKYCSKKCYREHSREYAREWGEKRKAEGLCRYCAKKATPGMATCLACRRKYRKKMKAQIAEWKADRKCVRCGRERAKGYRQCHLCLAYGSMWRGR